MPFFRYEALDAQGKRVSGEIEASDRSQALAKLQSREQNPLSLIEKHGTSAPASSRAASIVSPHEPERPLPGGDPLSKRDIIRFTEELADLLDSGMQVEPALASIENRKTSSPLKPLAGRIRRYLREGSPLSVSLRRSSPNFGELYLNMVQAGEQSGTLSVILRRQLSQMTMIENLKSRVRSALIYPSFMIVAAIGLTCIFVGYLVPQLQSLFTLGKGKMPLITQILILSSHFMSRWWWLLFICVGLAIWSFLAMVRRPAGRVWWHTCQLKIPGVGHVLMNAACSQIAQTLSTLHKNGISLLAAMKLVRNSTQNVRLQSALDLSITEISEGATLSRALRKRGVFPDEFMDLVTLGEQTGNLAGALEKAAARYDKELSRSISTLTELIEPALIVVMAVMVGMISFSMMSGIFQAVNALRPH